MCSAACPNRLRSEDLDNNILKHMSEILGFRMSEVIRFVTANTPSPATSTYHLILRKFTKYIAEMKASGKVAAVDTRVLGPKKVSLCFQV